MWPAVPCGVPGISTGLAWGYQRPRLPPSVPSDKIYPEQQGQSLPSPTRNKLCFQTLHGSLLCTEAALLGLGRLGAPPFSEGNRVGTEAQFSREEQQPGGSESFTGSNVLVTPPAGCVGSRAHPLGGRVHGYWEEEAICVEMKVSMTLWLDGSRWLWPLVESELWYNTRLLEDTAEAEEAAGCLPRPSRPLPAHHP